MCSLNCRSNVNPIVSDLGRWEARRGINRKSYRKVLVFIKAPRDIRLFLENSVVLLD